MPATAKTANEEARKTYEKRIRNAETPEEAQAIADEFRRKYGDPNNKGHDPVSDAMDALASGDGRGNTQQRDMAEDALFSMAMQSTGRSWTDPVTGTTYEAAPIPDAPGYVEEQAMDPLVFDQLGPSAMADVSANPYAAGAQWEALQGMQDIYNEGGLTAIDRARIAEARAAEDAYLRGQRESTIAEMNARGMGGSGMELLAQMQGQQAAGQRMAMAGLGTEAMALERRDAALQGMGDLGGVLRAQQWGEDAERAAAHDAIKRANWEASTAGKTATWGHEAERRARNTAGTNESNRYAYEAPMVRQKHAAGLLGGAVDTSLGRYNAATNRMNGGNSQEGGGAGKAGEVIGGITSMVGKLFGM